MLSTLDANAGRLDRVWMVPEYLDAVRLEAPQVWLELTQSYLDSAGAQLADLDRQLSLPDASAAARTLHSLKGSSRQIGGMTVGDIAEELESETETGAMRERLPDLNSAFDELRAQIEGAIAQQCGALER